MPRAKTLTAAALAVASMFLTTGAAALAAAPIELYWSPHGGAAVAIATEINAAKKSIDVAMFSLAELHITAALEAAHARGVTVRIFVTPSQQSDKQSTCPKLRKSGIMIRTDRAHALMHNKYAIIDNQVTITGSMNWSASGDWKNAENTIILRDPEIAKQFTDNWNSHWAHCTAFQAIHQDRLTPLPFPKPPLPTLRTAHRMEKSLWRAQSAPSCPSTPPAPLARAWSFPSGRDGTTFGSW